MDPKRLITLGALVGSTVGAYMPALWGGSIFSFTSLFLSGLGAFAGIYAGFKLSR